MRVFLFYKITDLKIIRMFYVQQQAINPYFVLAQHYNKAIQI
jgi:hypothetical protein